MLRGPQVRCCAIWWSPNVNSTRCGPSSARKQKNLDAIEQLEGVLGDAWIWIAFDAVNKVFLATVVGKRTEPHAVALLREVERVTAKIPRLFSS